VLYACIQRFDFANLNKACDEKPQVGEVDAVAIAHRRPGGVRNDKSMEPLGREIGAHVRTEAAPETERQLIYSASLHQ